MLSTSTLLLLALLGLEEFGRQKLLYRCSTEAEAGLRLPPVGSSIVIAGLAVGQEPTEWRRSV